MVFRVMRADLTFKGDHMCTRCDTSTKQALAALRYMHEHPSYGTSYGYTFSTLSRIAGLPDLPLPFEIGPRRREEQAAYADEEKSK